MFFLQQEAVALLSFQDVGPSVDECSDRSHRDDEGPLTHSLHGILEE